MASLAVYDPTDDRFDIRGVMGPDEFHDGYPDRPGGGIDNSAYVNVMTSWAWPGRSTPTGSSVRTRLPACGSGCV